ncbi:MAG: hypothetical protein COV66_14350 [Nitrospinae bacterium CG11_big_fil_rev_8_21_14_0_20_45_15]|nr:MAG: hypothetical protein COV66_14350 [Nitrospinae bacterium CG11_big_fil_rev_8_21_14_0_20_45_15]
MTDFQTTFSPALFIQGPLLQTIVGSQFPGTYAMPTAHYHKLDLGLGDKTFVLEIKSIDARLSPVVLMAHGMGGCSHSGYMKRITNKLHQRGFPVLLMNQRGSGAALGMSRRLWNGGDSEDLHHAVQFALQLYPDRDLLIAGFSLSANILLKYLGEGRNISSRIRGAFAVNPPVDLRSASHILSHSPACRIFNRYYMKLLKRQLTAVEECFPCSTLNKNPRTIWEFDVLYTAPAGGFADVEDYYSKSSSGQYLKSIKIPTILLCSEDDPFIPPSHFKSLKMSPAVDFVNPEYGGHMGYISKGKTSFGDRRWLDEVIMDWVEKRSHLS